MLKVTYGRAATGKSYNVINNICEDVKNGIDTVLLVPEQFTFESERTLLESLGFKNSTNVSVLSFTRLYDEVSRKAGGRVANNINDIDKALLMNVAFKSVKDDLNLWQKYVNSPLFTENLISIINEFKAASITSEDIIEVLPFIKNNYLGMKLKDISLIMAAYNGLLGNVFLDPADDLTRLNEKLLTYKYFEGKNVYIDSFKNFTGQQYKILERIISQANNVFLSVTSDDINSNDLSLFSNVNNTVNHIIKIAEKYSIEIEKSECLTENYYDSDALSELESFLAKKSAEIKNSKGITITKCDSVLDEAQYVAKTIKKLVRTENYRYRDFIIIARDAETYQKLIEKESKINDIYCFFDKRRGVSSLPMSVLINCALNLVKSFTSDDILNFHKTLLTELTIDEISELENYSYLWNLIGKQWLEEWTMNPLGFVAEEDNEQKPYQEKLDKLNSLRVKAISPILQFKKAFCGSAEDMTKAIVNLISGNTVKEKLKNQVLELEQINLKNEAENLRLGYDAIMDALGSFAKCLSEREIAPNEYIELWKTLLSNITVGNIPQTVDEITFGSADRIKPSRPKVAFVIGVNQGVFPANISANGILSQSDRTQLLEGGIQINDFGVNAVLDEDFLLYSSLCCATEKLYISFSSLSASGNELEPSQVISEILSAAPNLELNNYNPDELNEDSLPETLISAKTKLFDFFAKDKDKYETLNAALDNEISVKDFLDNFSKDKARVKSENALKLMGDKINISATGFDTFHRCKFSYFCRYGLGLKKIQPADFDVLQRGTLSHFVLEHLVKRHLDDFVNFTREDSDKKVDELVDEYLSLINGYERIRTPRTDFLVNIIADSLKDVAFHIINEMKQCEFRPEFFELKIGNDGVIPTLTVPFSETGEMRIRGSIDRVDIYGDYVRIVDYKTGTKVFKLPDILVGLNLQMLIYLYTVIRGENSYLNKKLPAGILYMPSKRDFGEAKALSMNGLILLDEGVIKAMDKEGEGEYIPPKPFKADGSLKSRYSSFGEPALFKETFDYIELLLKRMGNKITNGDFSADPVDGIDSDACKYCDFSSICCFEKSEHKCSDRSLSPAQVLEILKEANGSGI